MPRVSVVIPTHRERPTLLWTLLSVVEQSFGDFELIVIGDGCPDSTRQLMAQWQDKDARVRFVDQPKGANNGEAHRAAVLAGIDTEIVVYVSDDDLLMPDHLERTVASLASGNFFFPFVIFVGGDSQTLSHLPGDLSVEGWRQVLATQRRNFIPLTGAAHTLALYRSLEEGWSPAPKDVWSDLHMWRKFFRAPNFLPVSSDVPTALVFPTPQRRDVTPAARADEIERWYWRLHRAGEVSALREKNCAQLRRMLAERTLEKLRLAARCRKLEATLAQQSKPLSSPPLIGNT